MGAVVQFGPEVFTKLCTALSKLMNKFHSHIVLKVGDIICPISLSLSLSPSLLFCFDVVPCVFSTTYVVLSVYSFLLLFCACLPLPKLSRLRFGKDVFSGMQHDKK